jgi:hypothetical protein
MKITNVLPADALDRERMQKVFESEAFLLVIERLEAELKRSEEELTRKDSLNELMRAQGAVSALRLALRLPGQILAESREKK